MNTLITSVSNVDEREKEREKPTKNIFTFLDTSRSIGHALSASQLRNFFSNMGILISEVGSYFEGNVKAILRNLLISARSIYILLYKISTVYINR